MPSKCVRADSPEPALDFIDCDEILDLVAKLIALPTLPGQEGPGQDFVARVLQEAGIEVEVLGADIDALRRHPAYSAEFDRSEVTTVLGRIAGGAGPSLLLNAHIDVVPVGDLSAWRHDPFTAEVNDGVVSGRGACDTKGGLAAAIVALSAVRRSGVALPGDVTLACTVGEEDGGCGTLASLLAGVRADGCVILEPTELEVVCAVSGALSFRVHLSGRTAHGAMRYEGVNAIEKLPIVLDALQTLERERSQQWARDPRFSRLTIPFPICAGVVRGGDWPSNEAAWVQLEGRYGVSPDEDLDQARHRFEEAVAGAAQADEWLATHPPRIEWWGAQFLPGATDATAFPVTALATARQQETGAEVVPVGTPYGCDMGLTTRVGGMPTAVFGPGDIRVAHRPDEHVRASELVVCARTLVRLMMGGTRA